MARRRFKVKKVKRSEQAKPYLTIEQAEQIKQDYAGRLEAEELEAIDFLTCFGPMDVTEQSLEAAGLSLEAFVQGFAGLVIIKAVDAEMLETL